MAKRFPRTESDIAKLAGRVVDGLTNAAEDFPAPPVSSEEFRGKLDSFQAADGDRGRRAMAPRCSRRARPGDSPSSRRATTGPSCVGSPPRTAARPRSTGSSGARNGSWHSRGPQRDGPAQSKTGGPLSITCPSCSKDGCLYDYENRLHRKLDSPIDVALRSCAERNRSQRSTALNASYPFERRPHSSTGSHPDRVSLQ